MEVTSKAKEIIGKTIRYTREKRVKLPGVRVGTIVPDAHFDYHVVDIADADIYYLLHVRIDDDQDITTILLVPQEVDSLVDGQRVHLYHSGWYEVVA